MTSGPARPFISVKFNPVGRTQSFLLPDLALDPPAAPRRAGGAFPPPPPASEPPLVPGDAVVVQTAEGPAVGVVTRGIRSSPSAGAPRPTRRQRWSAGPPATTSSRG